jgi:hypothetical protein
MDLSSKLPFSGRKSLSVILLWLLIVAVAASSLMSSGAYSRIYTQQGIIIALFVLFVFYAVLISVMKSIGLEPNRLEMIVIPGILFMIIAVSLATMGFNPITEIEPDPEPNDLTTESDISIPDATTGSPPVANPGQQTAEVIDNVDNSYLMQMLSVVVVIILIVSIIAVLVYVLTKKPKSLPAIKFSPELEYSKSSRPNFLSILKIYVDASLSMEKLKGIAPRWYTPTYFSDRIYSDPGPPVASYFTRLTTIYELSRFSAEDVEYSVVEEAIDMHKEIMHWIEQVAKTNIEDGGIN